MADVQFTPNSDAILVTQNAVYGAAWILNFLLLLYSNIFYKENVRSRTTWLQALRMTYVFGIFVLSYAQRFGLGYMTKYDDPTVTVSFWYWIVTAVSFGLIGFDYAYEFHSGVGFSFYHGTISAGFGLFLALALLHVDLVIPFSIFAGVLGLIYLINAILVARTMNEKVQENKMDPYQRSVDTALFIGMSLVPLVYIVPWALEPAIGNKATNENVTIGYIVLDFVTRVISPGILWILHDRPKVPKFLPKYEMATRKNVAGFWGGAKKH